MMPWQSTVHAGSLEASVTSPAPVHVHPTKMNGMHKILHTFFFKVASHETTDSALTLIVLPRFKSAANCSNENKKQRSYWDLNSDFWIQNPMCSPLHHRTILKNPTDFTVTDKGYIVMYTVNYETLVGLKFGKSAKTSSWQIHPKFQVCITNILNWFMMNKVWQNFSPKFFCCLWYISESLHMISLYISSR